MHIAEEKKTSEKLISRKKIKNAASIYRVSHAPG
jgi:hypothetical protein